MTDRMPIDISINRAKRIVNLRLSRMNADVLCDPMDTHVIVGPMSLDQLRAFEALKTGVEAKVVGTISGNTAEGSDPVLPE